jgi:hypothetical protein
MGHRQLRRVARKDSNSVALLQRLLDQRSSSTASSTENKQFH